MARKIYGSANSEANLIVDLYGGVNNEAKRINKLYGSVLGQIVTGVTGEIESGGIGNVTSFDATTFWNNHDSFDSTAVNELKATFIATRNRYTLVLSFTDGTSNQTLITNATIEDLESYGITVLSSGSTGYDIISLTPIYSTIPMTKLIHQGFGHLDYTPYGYITYYTDNTHTTTAVAPIRTQEELDGFAEHSGSGNWSTTVDFGRVTVSTRGDHAITMISFTNKATFLKSYFLWGANYLDGEIVLPPSLTNISNGFLYSCDSSNITVNVGNLNANLGHESLSYPYFLSAGGNASYGSYVNGIKIAGVNRAAWMAEFPNRDTAPYRKLVDAGY